MNNKEIIKEILEKVVLIFIGYSLTHLGWYLLLLIISIVYLFWMVSKRKKIKNDQTKALEFLKNLKDIPSWVMFPDTERAEWLNEIFTQMWPNISNYIIKILRAKIQTNIRKKYGSFTFENVDLGSLPPKIEGVQVYKSDRVKDAIIIDFDIFYDGDSDIKFSYSRAHGGIKDLQLKALLRVVLKPLITKVPFIGAIQIFFLNTPDIDFNLYGITGIPGLNYYMRTTIENKLLKLIVFPNKITKRFDKSIDAAELKSIQPEGVLRVHVFEARNLERKDFGGTSDPYVILYVGAQEHKTQAIRRTVDPKWDYWCEFYILDPASQILGFKLYDDDDFREDEFLGSGEVDIKAIIKENKIDQWVKLEDAKHGEIHLRFTWLSLSSDYEKLPPALEEVRSLQVPVNSCLLMVYVESAHNLPMVKSFRKPHPYLTVTVGKTTQKTKTKKYSTNPSWEQGFVFFVENPETDELSMTIIDKKTDEILEKLNYKISNLKNHSNLEISKQALNLENGGKIIISLQLRILVSESTFDYSDSESDEDDFLKETEKMEQKLMPIQKAMRLQESNLGKIELTIDYSVARQKLIVTVHKISDLVVKDINDLPDSYVTVELSNIGSPSKKRTRIEKDSAHPIFEQKFEYVLSVEELSKQNLVVLVKNQKKHFFSHTPILGRVDIPLDGIIMKEQTRSWYNLCPE